MASIPSASMRLLDRYLLREFLLPFLYCLAGFTIFWICFMLSQEVGDLQRDGLSAKDIVVFYFLTFPQELPTVLPVALLLSLLYALTNHVRNHELVAMRAAGLSFWRLSLPYCVVGLALSITLFAINEWIAPGATAGAERLRTGHQTASGTTRDNSDFLQRNMGFTSPDGRVWEVDTYDSRNSLMKGVHLGWLQPDGTRRDLVAKSAQWTNGTWIFHEVIDSVFTNQAGAFPLRTVHASLQLQGLRETPEQIKAAIKVGMLSGNLRAAAKRAQLSLSEIQEYRRLYPDDLDRLPMLATQYHGRWALPWTCLVVVYIALPFGAASGRRNVFVGVAASLFICFSFFILSRLGLTLGTAGRVPAWLAAWGPNSVFGSIGLILTHRLR